MDFKEITKTEFDEFSKKHSQASFSQTSAWLDLKKSNGWEGYFLGVYAEDKIVAATLLLTKKIPIIKKRICYASRGFLIDYDNYELLKFFTEEIRKFAKNKNAIFIKIDPYISYQERDLDGNIINDGKNNKQAISNLKNLGYKHYGFNLMQDTLQPRWLFVTETKDKKVEDIMKNMDSKTRQIIRKNERLCIETREISYDELALFKDIMKHTSDRRSFIDRPLSYYQKMYKCFESSNILKILVAELHTDKLINSYKKEIKALQKDYDERKYKHDELINKMNENKYEQKQKSLKHEIERITKKLEEVEQLKKENGSVICLGGILFFIYGHEVLSLVGGSYDKFMQYQSAYTIHWEGCKYAIQNNYDRYNFYGITGDFSEKNSLLGLYLFKRGFGGKVVELIGEFDLIISKFWYCVYNCSIKIYHGLKRIKSKM